MFFSIFQYGCYNYKQLVSWLSESPTWLVCIRHALSLHTLLSCTKHSTLTGEGNQGAITTQVCNPAQLMSLRQFSGEISRNTIILKVPVCFCKFIAVLIDCMLAKNNSHNHCQHNFTALFEQIKLMEEGSQRRSKKWNTMWECEERIIWVWSKWNMPALEMIKFPKFTGLSNAMQIQIHNIFFVHSTHQQIYSNLKWTCKVPPVASTNHPFNACLPPVFCSIVPAIECTPH